MELHVNLTTFWKRRKQSNRIFQIHRKKCDLIKIWSLILILKVGILNLLKRRILMSTIFRWQLIRTQEDIRNGFTSLWRTCSEIKKSRLISSILQNLKCCILEGCKSWLWVMWEMKESTMERKLGKLREVISGTSGTIFNEKFEKILIMKVTLTMKVKKRRRITRIKSHLQRRRKENDSTTLWVFSINFNTQETRFILLTQYHLLTHRSLMIWFKKRNSYKALEEISNCLTLSTVQRNSLKKMINLMCTFDFKMKKRSCSMNERICATQF